MAENQSVSQFCISGRGGERNGPIPVGSLEGLQPTNGVKNGCPGMAFYEFSPPRVLNWINLIKSHRRPGCPVERWQAGRIAFRLVSEALLQAKITFSEARQSLWVHPDSVTSKHEMRSIFLGRDKTSRHCFGFARLLSVGVRDSRPSVRIPK